MGKKDPIFLSFSACASWERVPDTATEAHLAGTKKRKAEDGWGDF